MFGDSPAAQRNCIADIWDGDAMEALKSQHPDFFSNPDNLLLALTADGFLAWGKQASQSTKEKGKGKSIWPITLTLFNLPPDIRTKLGASMPLGFTPLQHMQDIQPFLEPLMDELNLLWHGIDIFNACTGKTSCVRAMLVHVDADYPGLAKLLGRKQQPTSLACFLCQVQGFIISKGKAIYAGVWRWLCADHEIRQQAHVFNYQPPPATPAMASAAGSNTNSTASAPPAPTTQAPSMKTKDELDPSSSVAKQEELRPCVFWQLPYFDPTLMVSYDAMHTIAGVLKDVFTCMAGDVSEHCLQYDKLVNK
jgi:hypothetical protein